MAITVYNRTKEDYSFMPNNYYIGRGGVLGNPFSHLPEDKCQAIYKCKTRQEAIDRYSGYFDLMYAHNQEFRAIIDEIYQKYKNGEDIFFECYCKPEPCHGDIIAEKLQQKLFKERFNEIKKQRENGRTKEMEKVL